jgi:hypothetical protein
MRLRFVQTDEAVIGAIAGERNVLTVGDHLGRCCGPTH